MNILDIAENSVRAGASLTEISVDIDDDKDLLTIRISDNGCGMDSLTARRVTDPFYTSRSTRKVGLGLPFFAMAARQTGGDLTIDSEVGSGTAVTATFGLNHIDRMPLGDMASTVSTLIQCNPEIDFVYTLTRDGDSFTADSREMKAILDGVPISNPEVSVFIREFIDENSQHILNKGD